MGTHYPLSRNRIVRSRHFISSIVPPMMFSCAFFFTSFIYEPALLKKKARWIRLDRSLVVREIEKLTNTSAQLAKEHTRSTRLFSRRYLRSKGGNFRSVWEYAYGPPLCLRCFFEREIPHVFRWTLIIRRCRWCWAKGGAVRLQMAKKVVARLEMVVVVVRKAASSFASFVE